MKIEWRVWEAMNPNEVELIARAKMPNGEIWSELRIVKKDCSSQMFWVMIHTMKSNMDRQAQLQEART